MIVIIGKKAYKADPKIADELLKIASDSIPFGIYALKKGGKLEMRRDKCKNMTELKRLTRHFKSNGYKVYSNKGD